MVYKNVLLNYNSVRKYLNLNHKKINIIESMSDSVYFSDNDYIIICLIRTYLKWSSNFYLERIL